MLKLIQNEWMKLWHQKGTYAMLVILAVIVIGAAGLYKYLDETSEGDWRTIEQDNIEMYRGIIVEEQEHAPAYVQEGLAISEYRLANDVAPPNGMTIANFLKLSAQFISIITLFMVIVAASIVSSEFATGTIKMLLTRPASRAKILTSKLLTTFLFGLFLLAVNFTLAWVVGLLLFNGSGGTALEVVNGVVQEENVWKNLAELTLLSTGDLLMSVLFAFLLGSVFRSSAIAIGLTMFLSFTGSVVVLFMSKYAFAKYIWLTHTDLSQYAQGGQHMIEGVTMPFSIIVLAAYALLFLLISYTTFMKRDVTA